MIFKFKSLVLFYFFIYSSLLNGQSIISVVLNSGNSGTSLTAAITGQNTVFMNGSPMGINSIYFGASGCVNVSGTNINVINDTNLNVDFNIPAVLGNGNYDIHVITNSLQHYLLSGGFSVTGGANYILSAISPDSVMENTTLQATISGTNLQAFYAAGNAQVNLNLGGHSIAGINLNVVNSNTLSADFVIPAYSTDGFYDLKLSGDAGCLAMPQGVHVKSSQTRSLVSMNPSAGVSGTTLSAVVTGQDLFFMTGSPQNGIGSFYLQNGSCNTVVGTALNAIDDDHISVDFPIPANSTNGFYDLFAGSTSGTLYSLANACSVSSGIDRNLLSIVPGTINANSYYQATITGTGLDDIAAGSNLRIWLSSPNLTIYDSTYALISPTELDASFLIPIYAGNGYYDLHVESSKGCFKLLNAVQVNGGLFRGLVSLQPSVGHRAQQLTAMLTGQYAYFMNSTSPSIDFQEANGSFQYSVGSTNVTYIDTDHVSLTFTVPPAAPAGFYNVRAGLTLLNDYLTLQSGFEITGYVASGRIFLDLDSNGVFDPGEVYLSGKRVRLLPDSIVTFTDTQGYYFLPVDNGNYTIECIPDSDWHITSSPLFYSIQISNGDYYGMDFGIKPDYPVATSDVSMSAGTPRCNSNAPYYIHYNYFTTSSLTAFFTLILDSNMSYTSAVPSPLSVNGDTIVWSIAVNPVVGSGQINLNVLFPPLAGTSLASSLTLELKNGVGVVISESVDTMRQVVVCSFDPNDKSVNPPGVAASNYTLNNSPLQYQIRFQNTGTDTAFAVHILDTIDTGLDINSFQLLGSSHPVQVLIHPNRIVDFRFEDILLPDSVVDEPGSHGYILYRIRPEELIPDPIEIRNTAYIYFDFNLPVATNTTVNTLVSHIPVGLTEISGSASPLRLFPNPASEELFYSFDNPHLHAMRLQVFDAKATLLNTLVVFGGSGVLNCKSYDPGLYLMQFTDLNSGKVLSGKFIVK